MVDVRQTTPDYLRVMRLTLQHGRWLAPSDIRGGQPRRRAQRRAARRYLGSEPAVGADVTFQLKTWKVVGVVKGLRTRWARKRCQTRSVHRSRRARSSAQVVLRGWVTHAAGRRYQRGHASVNPRAAPEVEALDELFNGLIATRRFNMLLLSMFGVLAVYRRRDVGVCGVMAFLHTMHQEIAVRIALGADATTVLGPFSRRPLVLLAGLALGFIGALSLAGLTEAFLFQVRPYDGGVYAATGAVIVIAGLIAAWLPAARRPCRTAGGVAGRVT